MFHRAPIQKRHEGTGVIERAGGAACRGVNNCRFQIPEDARGQTLPERHQALARGNHAGDGLVQIGENGAVFIQAECAAGQSKSRTVMNDAAGFARGLQSSRKNGNSPTPRTAIRKF